MTTHMSLPPIEVGTRLTDYGSLDVEVEGSAEGGYGLVVWGPNHAQGNQKLALKLLRADLLARADAFSSDEGERLRRDFEREALTWLHLWPHVAIVTAQGLTRLPGWNDLPVLVLEYAPGGSLRRPLNEAHGSRTARLTLEAALAWGQQIAAALAVIHQPDPACERPDPLIHCDLKPENVLLNAHGWAQLTDLGLTRAYATTTLAEAGSSATHAEAFEQESGEGGDQEAREVRVARMRAALQAAGLLDVRPRDPTMAAFPLKPAAATDQRQAAEPTVGMRAGSFQTRSMRAPALSAAQLTTLLAPHPASLATPAAAPAALAGTALATEPGIGSRGPALGTPPYMPPEQWWGLDAVTPASDVYALGVLLFELFTGGRWSFAQRRWLDDEMGASDTSNVGERYVRFPHAPQFTPEARAFAESGVGGMEARQAYFAMWYAAHRAGPRWRLDDPAVGALTRGPLAKLAEQPEQATRMLQALSQLITDCLAPVAARRPAAETVRLRLGAIARLAGVEPLEIPEVTPHIPENEATFWGNLAITYGKIGMYEERLRLRRREVELDAEDPSRWMNLGVAFFDLKRYEEALASHAEAIRWLTPAYQAREPQRAARLALGIPRNQANALAGLKRFEEAVAIYRRVLAQRPDKTDARFSLALTLAQWSEEAGATREQRLERLRAAHVEAQQMLAEAPAMSQGQTLLDRIERDLARLGGA